MIKFNIFTKIFGYFKVLFSGWKLFVFLFLCVNLSAQNERFGCTLKMDEFSQWKPVSVNITVDGNLISVVEVYGIELRISVDKRFRNADGSVGYIMMFNGEENLRMMYQLRSPGLYLVSVLKNHYLCKILVDN